MNNDSRNFVEEVRPFLVACPGPSVAVAGLRIAALQRVKGIPGLSVKTHEGGDAYLRTIGDIAALLSCQPEYLSAAARRRGYHYSHALRWIRFLHLMALMSEGCPSNQVAWRLGFHDVAGMTRFTKSLHGRSLRQLPTVPLSFWIRRAIEGVFLASRERLVS